jgi:hypothetical protein
VLIVVVGRRIFHAGSTFRALVGDTERYTSSRWREQQGTAQTAAARDFSDARLAEWCHHLFPRKHGLQHTYLLSLERLCELAAHCALVRVMLYGHAGCLSAAILTGLAEIGLTRSVIDRCQASISSIGAPLHHPWMI